MMLQTRLRDLLMISAGSGMVNQPLEVVGTANCVDNYERRDSRNFEIHF